MAVDLVVDLLWLFEFEVMWNYFLLVLCVSSYDK